MMLGLISQDAIKGVLERLTAKTLAMVFRVHSRDVEFLLIDVYNQH